MLQNTVTDCQTGVSTILPRFERSLSMVARGYYHLRYVAHADVRRWAGTSSHGFFPAWENGAGGGALPSGRRRRYKGALNAVADRGAYQLLEALCTFLRRASVARAA